MLQHSAVADSALEQALREVSQRRKSGVLTVLSGGRPYEISCVQGRVVQVLEQQANPFVELYDRLLAAEFSLPELPGTPLQSYGDILKELLSAQAGEEGVVREQLRRVVRASIEGKLSQLLGAAGDVLGFAPSMVEFDHAWAPAIPIAQFLLDWVEYRGREGEFQERFPAGQGILRGRTVPDQPLPPTELAVLQILQDKPLPIESLYVRSCLGPIEFQTAVLHLQSCGALESVSAERESSDAPAPAVSMSEAPSPTVLTGRAVAQQSERASAVRRQWITDARLRLQNSQIIEVVLIWVVAAASCSIPFIAWEPFLRSVLGRY